MMVGERRGWLAESASALHALWQELNQARCSVSQLVARQQGKMTDAFKVNEPNVEGKAEEEVRV